MIVILAWLFVIVLCDIHKISMHSKSNKFIKIGSLKVNLSIGLLCATVNTRYFQNRGRSYNDVTHSGFCCVQKIFLRTRYDLCTVYILIRRMIVADVRADSIQFIFSHIFISFSLSLSLFLSYPLSLSLSL